MKMWGGEMLKHVARLDNSWHFLVLCLLLANLDHHRKIVMTALCCIVLSVASYMVPPRA